MVLPFFLSLCISSSCSTTTTNNYYSYSNTIRIGFLYRHSPRSTSFFSLLLSLLESCVALFGCCCCCSCNSNRVVVYDVIEIIVKFFVLPHSQTPYINFHRSILSHSFSIIVCGDGLHSMHRRSSFICRLASTLFL